MKVKPTPEGYHTVTAYLIIKGASKAIDFYTRAFGAKELFRIGAPGGKIGHAEMTIGDSHIMLADEMPEMKIVGPKTLGGSPVQFLIYVDKVDSAFPKAIAAGGKETKPLADQFYGDRSGTLEDPFGHVWTLATHTEDVSPEEMDKRIKEMAKK